MTIHNVDMYRIGTTALGGANSFTQFREVSRKN
ncbi:uncharacterized protein METZ01_LOCUS140463 [marine metagenome]|uniref:Uncharacterized protein n=1 Tax=marine metagenome TaxID=408172 RepID=A0A381ZEG7_9ZZZZ